jgi:hypothetical protein
MFHIPVSEHMDSISEL